MPIANGDTSSGRFIAMRFASKGLLGLLLFASCGTALRAQSIQIALVNGKTGGPITDRPLLNVRVGHDREFPFEIPIDKHGIALLRLTHDDSEMNVPDCKGMQADSEKLQMNRNKKDVAEFNKKYKYCRAFEVKNPVVRFAESISIGPVNRLLDGNTYFQYIPCVADLGTVFSTDEILRHGVVTANKCGKATASPQPGQLILFVRLPTQREAGRQAWN